MLKRTPSMPGGIGKNERAKLRSGKGAKARSYKRTSQMSKREKIITAIKRKVKARGGEKIRVTFVCDSGVGRSLEFKKEFAEFLGKRFEGLLELNHAGQLFGTPTHTKTIIESDIVVPMVKEANELKRTIRVYGSSKKPRVITLVSDSVIRIFGDRYSMNPKKLYELLLEEIAK